MKKIGVVLPCVQGSDSFLKRLFKNRKYETVTVGEYGLEFLCVYDWQKCSKIFNKNGVENIVLITDKPIERCNFRILDGRNVFLKMIPEFVRKTAKSFENGCSVAVADKRFSKDGRGIVENLCTVCPELTLITDKKYDAENFCDRLFDKYGIVINVVDGTSHIDKDMVIVLEDCGNVYSEKSTLVDKDRSRKRGNVVNDFYIPFSVKPPFGMSNLTFAECIETADFTESNHA